MNRCFVLSMHLEMGSIFGYEEKHDTHIHTHKIYI